jgi:SAM-dependent methyltransferase
MRKRCEIPAESVANYYAPYLDDASLHSEVLRLYKSYNTNSATGWLCPTCGHLAFLPVIEDTDQFYRLFNRRKKDPSWRPEYNYARDILSKLQARSSVVDIGAGQGNFLRSLDGKYRRIAIDPGMDATPRDSENGLEWLKDIKTVEQILGSKVDLITLFQSLEHMPDPLTLMREIRALLREGGSCIVSVPLAPTNLILFDRTNAIDVPPVHFNYFSKNGVTRLFAKAGFKAIETTEVGGWSSEFQSAIYYKFRRLVAERMQMDRRLRNDFDLERKILLASAVFRTVRGIVQLGAARTLVIKAGA